MKRSAKLAAALALLALPAAMAFAPVGPAAGADTAAAPAPAQAGQIVAMRRLTEAQYRNSIADIFGPDIRVSGRFEPIVRPVHEMIASGARRASISPTGLENFDAMARVIAAQVFDAQHRALFAPCAPADAKTADDRCAAQVLAPLGRYLFRRPLTLDEQAFYVRMAGAAAGKAGSFDKGLELALSAMLVSPNFLYVIERAEPDPANPGQLRLDNGTRATRLAMMLWNSAPNEALLKAAAEGRLTDQKQLEAAAAAMVSSPRFEQGLRAFFADMLLFEKFDELAKDPVVYPYFNQDVAQALPEQTLRTITDHLLTRNGDYRQLFTTSHTFMTRALGPVYQVPVHRAKGWEPYEFGPRDDRAGLIGQAGFLSLYSHSGRSSPTLRGRAIREVLMCQPVPNPPGNVNFTAVQDVHNKAMPTARIRLTAHNTDPVCAGCHKITDPVGLSLERFDGIGAWRASENDAPIDAGGMMDGVKFEGGAGLGKALSESPDTPICVASRALEYAVGKPPEDEALVERLVGDFAGSGYAIRALFLKVATMPETWRVTAPVLDNATHVSFAAPATMAGRTGR
ncbi:MAG: DUF1588 domain-containing protein [Sphingomonadales bacterium]|nr:DUF1588 domain-containing protein [Sphingomonadales bacterium]